MLCPNHGSIRHEYVIYMIICDVEYSYDNLSIIHNLFDLTSNTNKQSINSYITLEKSISTLDSGVGHIFQNHNLLRFPIVFCSKKYFKHKHLWGLASILIDLSLTALK